MVFVQPLDRRGPANLTLQPGFNVTLLMSEKVHFYCAEENAKTFVIKDDNGKKVFEQSIDDQTKGISIDPRKANLKAGQKYSWSVNGNGKVYNFTILDSNSEKEILKKLAEIEKKFSSPDESLLKKANYLQLLSDASEHQIDLYWLSYQWLSKISSNNEEIKNEKLYLLDECQRHYILEKVRNR